jgi:putative hemolysin
VYRLLFVLGAVVLVGCASSRSPEAQAQADAQAQAEVAANDSAKCQSYGLRPGTTEFEKCLTQLADKRAQADSNSRSALAGRLQGQPPAWAR